MTSILDHQSPQIRSCPIKTKVKWALGKVYIFITSWLGCQTASHSFALGHRWSGLRDASRPAGIIITSFLHTLLLT